MPRVPGRGYDSPVPANEYRTPPTDESAAERAAMLKILRAIFLILLVVFTALLIVTDSTLAEGGIELERWWPAAVVIVLVYFASVVGLDLLTTRRKLSTISAIFFGLIVGVIVTAIIGIVIDLFADIYEFDGLRLLEPIKILLGLGICYLTISTVLQTQGDFRLVIPYIEFAKKIRGARPLILDTSALIDARVLGLSDSGLFQAPLIVPRFVLNELQQLSDSTDRTKRAKGRRGLETVAKLQQCPLVHVNIDESTPPGAGADQMLVELARTLPGTLITTDVGLRQVAGIQGVPVINLNEIATALKQAAITGEPLTLTIVRRGEQAGQGVGYLEDGTMIVVEDGEAAIGSEATVTVTSSMQTSAGRLIFGRIGHAETPHIEKNATPTTHEPEQQSPPRSTIPAGPLGPARTEPAGRRGDRNPRRG